MSTKGHTVYCHFSFRRPKGQQYGLFAVAFYSDYEGKNLLIAKTRKFDLWEDQQFVTAIQSYEHALATIYELQGEMLHANVRQVMLVTDNSTLAGWIIEPTKNKWYTEYMKKAVQNYKIGGAKEIVVGVGLCEPRKSEKSYKFCTEKRVCNNYTPSNDKEKKYAIPIGKFKSANDIIEEDISVPQIIGMESTDIKKEE